MNALRGKGNVFDRQTGKMVSSLGHNYACCRFTLSEPYVLGANMDMIDLSDNGTRALQTALWVNQEVCAAVPYRQFVFTTQHIPDPGEHLIRYDGWYSNKSRALRANEQAQGVCAAVPAQSPGPPAPRKLGDAGPP